MLIFCLLLSVRSLAFTKKVESAEVIFAKRLRIDLPAFPVLVHDVQVEIVLVTVILELNVTLLVALEIFLRDDLADTPQTALRGFDVWSERANLGWFFAAFDVCLHIPLIPLQLISNRTDRLVVALLRISFLLNHNRPTQNQMLNVFI